MDTLDRTIEVLGGECPVGDEEFFAGLAEGRARLREDLVSRYGGEVEDHFGAAKRATAGWSREDYEQAAADARELLTRMSQARSRGVSPGDDEALDLVADHHRGVLVLRPADSAAYHALGEVLVDNSEQRPLVAAIDPQLPAWLSAAIKAYAICRLGHNQA
ncbi:MAG: TipAS antibiotic-recognition domain-containing protein [Actinomycetota bacterium]|nr:TipAS antibiotic-recognition domain-containing protein [Actinomycetota bacterium]